MVLVVESVQQREQKFEEVVLAVKPYVPENTKMVGQNAEVLHNDSFKTI